MTNAPLLIELGCEELPAGACRIAEREAGSIVERFLVDRRLTPAGVRTYVTPRRIAVIADAVPSEQPAETVVHRGPPERAARDEDGSWSKAAVGFARKHGLTPEDLGSEDGLLVAVVEASTEPLEAHAQDLVDALIEGLQMPKNMRWGAGALRFSRPIRTLVVLHGERVLPAVVQGVAADRVVRGHRVRRPWFSLATVDDYVTDLGGAGVAAATDDRREVIETLLTTRVAERGARWEDPGGVLDEVVYLVEWPDVVVGGIEARHLDLPEPVLITAMQSHQRYLPLRDSTGALVPAFATVVNSDPAAIDVVRAGNERVLAGRLDDAVFSLAKDRERGLEAMAADLDRITFHQRLGSLADRTARLRALVAVLAEGAGVDAETRASADEAARLAKADLASTLVGEFAELQGVVGADYARSAGFGDAVADAIYEQYLPDGARRPLPRTSAGALLAMADRLDQLVGVVAVGERPTGSRDPYALRRAAQGIVEIQANTGFPLDLPRVVAQAYALLRDQGADLELSAEETAAFVVPFVLDRVDQVLGDEGVPVDVQRAARGAELLDPADHAALARALHAAADAPSLAAVHAAVNRLSRIADPDGAAPTVDVARLTVAEERALAAAIGDLGPAIAAAPDPSAALDRAAELVPAVDALFEAVMIVDDDPEVRAQRLALVQAALAAFAPIGDLTRLQR